MSRRAMGVYVRASTANPTGWRPWNSRLGFYVPNSFPLPTTGRGPWLLQPGAPCAKPAAAGGLGAVDFPNYAGFGGPRNWISRVQSWVPSPVYGPPPSVRMRLTGLGAVPANNVRMRRSGSILPPVAVVSSSAANSPAQTWRSQQNNQNRNRRQQNQNSNYEGWSSGQQPQSYQQWQQQQAQTGSLSQGAAGSVVGYDASGNPIYSSPPAGMSVVGTDAQGNPIYGTAGAAAATSTPSTSILSEDSLGLGLPNWAYAGIGLGLVLIFKKR